ncbi:breast carcinoma-amplified sequence 1 isoform X22 [Scomber scombrus]|uniref:Breast carcinoma-amplified sequence 1 isoform X22 n=1 Tax=Scomber scombrus TaxID=13677 RepID=A0AAV1PJV0_SCOSC
MGNEHSKNKELAKKGKIAGNGAVNGISTTVTANVNTETVIVQNGTATSLNPATEYVIVESAIKMETIHEEIPADDAAAVDDVPETLTPVSDDESSEKKCDSCPEEEITTVRGIVEAPSEENQLITIEKHPEETQIKLQSIHDLTITDVDFGEDEAGNLKQEPESLTEPERGTLNSGPGEEKAPLDERNSEPVENQEESIQEENPVMNFFKTLVNPTKTSKKETATPDATKEQSQKEAEPAPTTTVAQVSEPPAAASKGMSIPPPPPPEPPKMEVKAEPAAKPVKPTPKEEPKAAAKEPESSKGKSAKDTLSRFFRSKKNTEPEQPAVEIAGQEVVDSQETPEEVAQPVVEVQRENEVEPQETAGEVAQTVVEQQTVEEVPQPVVEAEKVDPSKASTLEAAAKPEPPPPVQEEKKLASKSSFLSFFKPKVLLDNMTTKVQAASTSGVRLLRKATGVADEPKKATPAPAAGAEAAQTVKAKDEPKAAAKSSEAAVDNKPASDASQAGDDAAKGPKKLEKRNSIHLFFKNLGQKRHSTDAGVQTEPAVVAPAAEKAK